MEEHQPETPKILEELSRSNTAKPASRQQSTARKRFIVVLGIFSVIVVGVALLGYQQWMLQSHLASLSQQNEQLTSTLAAQDSEIETLRATHEAAAQTVAVVDDTAMRELEATLNSEITRLRQQLATVQQQQSTASTEINLEWKILEAEYLLEIANQKLQLESDPAAAIGLLEGADEALVASGSGGAFAVRQAIAADLQLLRDIPVTDREDTYLRLEALVSQVEQIDLLDSMRENFQSRRDTGSNPVSETPATDGLFAASLEFLGSIFIWRKWDDVPVTMLAPGQDTQIKQNLRLLLEQAKLALMMRDDPLYHRSLESSADWIQHFAAPDSVTGQNLLTAINALLALNIDPPLPSLDRSLLAIHQLTASEN